MTDFDKKVKALERYVERHDAYMEERGKVQEFSGELFRWLREDMCKISVRKMAAVFGVSPSYLSKIERGIEVVSPELAKTFLDQYYQRGK